MVMFDNQMVPTFGCCFGQVAVTYFRTMEHFRVWALVLFWNCPKISHHFTIPRCSMYGIFTYIYQKKSPSFVDKHIPAPWFASGIYIYISYIGYNISFHISPTYNQHRFLEQPGFFSPFSPRTKASDQRTVVSSAWGALGRAPVEGWLRKNLSIGHLSDSVQLVYDSKNYGLW